MLSSLVAALRSASAALTYSLALATAVAACDDDGPTEPEEPEEALPAFVVGINFPWVKYGLDFGESGFGQFGLSTDCSEGFRPERFPGSHGIIACERSRERVRNGSFALKALVNIAGTESERPQNGEVTTDFHDISEVPEDHSVDLDGDTVTASVYVNAGNRGDPSRPNFLQLFVKDNSPGAVGLYSSAFNIPDTAGWVDLKLTVRKVPGSAFAPRHVRLLGIKIGIGGGSSAQINDTIYVDRIRATDPAIAFDFETPSRAEVDAMRLTAAGVKVLRWFVFADGRASPEFDSQNYVTGLDAQFIQDFRVLLSLAKNHGFRVIPVLFDFLLCGNPTEFNGVPLFGRAELIRDPARWSSLLTNAIDPLLAQFGAAPEVLAWEVMNEPEWCLSDMSFPGHISRPKELPATGAVTTAQMQAFVAAVANFIRGHRGTVQPMVTVGSASPQYVATWQRVAVNLCQFHFYNSPGQLDAGASLPATHECLLGEFPSFQDGNYQSVLLFLEHACIGRYAGAIPWSWRARDDVSPVGAFQQERLLQDMAAFMRGVATCPRPLAAVAPS